MENKNKLVTVIYYYNSKFKFYSLAKKKETII